MGENIEQTRKEYEIFVTEPESRNFTDRVPPPKSTANAEPEFTVSPPVRRPIRTDFPDIVRYDPKNWSQAIDKLISVVEMELAKDGKTLDTAGSISIVYPTWMEDSYAASSWNEYNLSQILEKKTGKKWIAVEDIFQTRWISKTTRRSEKWYMQQQFASATAFKPNDKRHYFIVMDDTLEYGTTLASLISYIEHHGGKVLAGIVEGIHTGSSLASDPNWIHHKHGALIADAVESGLRDEKPDMLKTQVEKNWHELARRLNQIGFDIRYATEMEKHKIDEASLHPEALKHPSEMMIDPKDPIKRTYVGKFDVTNPELAEHQKETLRQRNKESQEQSL